MVDGKYSFIECLVLLISYTRVNVTIKYLTEKSGSGYMSTDLVVRSLEYFDTFFERKK